MENNFQISYVLRRCKKSLKRLKLSYLLSVILFPIFFISRNIIAMTLLCTANYVFAKLMNKIEENMDKEIIKSKEREKEQFNRIREQSRLFLKILDLKLCELGYDNSQFISLYEEYLNCESSKDLLTLQKKIMEVYEKLELERKTKENFKQNHEYYTTYGVKKTKIEKYLETLGLSQDTRDINIIKKQYKKMIKIYHPDVNNSPEALKISQALNTAYTEIQKVLA